MPRFRLGKTKADQGDTVRAEELYAATVEDCTQAIELDPESAYAYGNRGVAKAAIGDAEGAIEDFDTALRINPEYAEIYYDRGRAKAALGQKEAAQADFQKGQGVGPRCRTVTPGNKIRGIHS